MLVSACDGVSGGFTFVVRSAKTAMGMRVVAIAIVMNADRGVFERCSIW